MSNPDDLAALKIERKRPQSYRGRRVPRIVWVAGIALLVVLGWFGAGALQGPLVELVPVTKASALATANGDKGGWSELNAAGYIVADRQSTVAAKYTARVKVLKVREAQRVAENEVVAELDHAELDAQIAQLEAEAEQAAAQVAQTRKAVEQADKEHAAAKAALGTMKGQIAELEVALADAKRRLGLDLELVEKLAGEATRVQDRETEVRMAQARIATMQSRLVEAEHQTGVVQEKAAWARLAVGTAEAQHRATKARVAVLQAQREDYFVRAPFAGVISERIAEQGEIVAPVSMGGTMAKGAIVTIVDWDSLQAEVDVAEAYLERVKTGGRAAITVDAIPSRVWPGRVHRILPRADKSKATVQVRVEFLERDGLFLPNMGVRVKFLPENAPEGAERGLVADPLLVPSAAVQGEGADRFVWVVREGKAHRQAVEVGPAHGTNLEVHKGLLLGDRVVVSGAGSLSNDGQAVRVQETAQ